MAHITAPFTEQQIANLVTWQQSECVHPYTCPNRSDPGHITSDRDHGMLDVNANGLHCPTCNYTQQWAHDAIAPTNPFTTLRSTDNKHPHNN